MTKRILLFLLLATIVFASCFRVAHAPDVKTDVSLSTGYRVDDLSWSIAGNPSGSNPNVLSEVIWSDLETFQAAVSGRALVNEWFYVRGAFGYGWTLSGGYRDSDFSGNDRTREYSQSSGSADYRPQIVFQKSRRGGAAAGAAAAGVRVAPGPGPLAALDPCSRQSASG